MDKNRDYCRFEVVKGLKEEYDGSISFLVKGGAEDIYLRHTNNILKASKYFRGDLLLQKDASFFKASSLSGGKLKFKL